MNITKEKHLEEWKIDDKFPMDRIRLEMVNEQGSLTTLFGVDGNIIEEVTNEQILDGEYSDDMGELLEMVGII